jgi:hypothetical protein
MFSLALAWCKAPTLQPRSDHSHVAHHESQRAESINA